VRAVAVDEVVVVSWAGLASVGGPGGLLVVAGGWRAVWVATAGSPGEVGSQGTGARGGSPPSCVSLVWWFLLLIWV
jgi:hypothetical protein